jgi:hypothetical protein
MTQCDTRIGREKEDRRERRPGVFQTTRAQRRECSITRTSEVILTTAKTRGIYGPHKLISTELKGE